MNEKPDEVPGAADAAPGFLVPPGLGEALMDHLREGFAALDAWEESHFGPPRPGYLATARAGWKLRDLRGKTARLAYRAIAGYWPREDNW